MMKAQVARWNVRRRQDHQGRAIRSSSHRKTIECRDAILGRDGSDPDRPQVSVVIGPPSFFGVKLLVGGLKEIYAFRVFCGVEGACAPRKSILSAIEPTIA